MRNVKLTVKEYAHIYSCRDKDCFYCNKARNEITEYYKTIKPQASELPPKSKSQAVC